MTGTQQSAISRQDPTLACRKMRREALWGFLEKGLRLGCGSRGCCSALDKQGALGIEEAIEWGWWRRAGNAPKPTVVKTVKTKEKQASCRSAHSKRSYEAPNVFD